MQEAIIELLSEDSDSSDSDGDETESDDTVAAVGSVWSRYCCYLIKSQASRHKNKSYIGFTSNPSRRIRQHNGELKRGGAKKTKSGRPWEFLVIVSGFPNSILALQFEWMWQHPTESRMSRDILGESVLSSSKRSMSWMRNLESLFVILALPQIRRIHLQVNFFDAELLRQVALDLNSVIESSGATLSLLSSPSLLIRQRQQASSANCSACANRSMDLKLWTCPKCFLSFHLTCLASNHAQTIICSISNNDDFNGNETNLVPDTVKCPSCQDIYEWYQVVRLVT